MFRHVLVLFAAGLALAADPKDDPARDDKEKMQGTWTVEAASKGGEALPRDKIDKMRVTITGDKIVIRDGEAGRTEEATFKLDPAAKPKTMDVIPGGGPSEKAVPGIYQLDGDVLKLCWSKGGKDRPTDFTTGKEDRRMMFHLKRAK